LAKNNIFQNHSLQVSSRAQKQLSKIPSNYAAAIHTSLNKLIEEDVVMDIKKMQGEESTYRLRIGNYRVIFEHHKKTILILVIEIGHRKDIYKG
jgi:mRNA interferase RelE/StbE